LPPDERYVRYSLGSPLISYPIIRGALFTQFAEGKVELAVSLLLRSPFLSGETEMAGVPGWIPVA
jgi:hypothetical protein